VDRCRLVSQQINKEQAATWLKKFKYEIFVSDQEKTRIAERTACMTEIAQCWAEQARGAPLDHDSQTKRKALIVRAKACRYVVNSKLAVYDENETMPTRTTTTRTANEREKQGR